MYMLRNQISNNLTLHLKELEKEQTKPKVSRKKEIIKMRAEINVSETKKKQKQKTHNRSNETRSWFFEIINKIDKPLASLVKKKKEGHLGGSVCWASDIGFGHDLIGCGLEPHIRLCANSSEPGACFGFCVSLSLCPSPNRALCVCLSLKNKHNK